MFQSFVLNLHFLAKNYKNTNINKYIRWSSLLLFFILHLSFCHYLPNFWTEKSTENILIRVYFLAHLKGHRRSLHEPDPQGLSALSVLWFNLIHILVCEEFYIIGLDIRQCLYKSSPKNQGYKYKHISLIWLIDNGNIHKW